MSRLRSVLIWLVVLTVVAVPIAVAAGSPFLAYREAVYILAGFAGIFGLAAMFLQPLLIAGALPGSTGQGARRWHVALGGLLVIAIVLHVGGLWLTSPPDVIDALTFRSPTPFSVWGVLAMWAILAAAVLASLRQTLPVRIWRLGHSAVVTLAVATTIAHAVLIEGTMGQLSKLLLCAGVVIALAQALRSRRTLRLLTSRTR